MNARTGMHVLLLSLTTALTACPQAISPSDPTTFPVSEISGTILNWTSGEAYLTCTGVFSASSTEDPAVDDIDIAQPAYQTILSSTGNFTVTLGTPQTSELIPLVCGDTTYLVGFIALAAVTTTPQPTKLDEVLGLYTLGPLEDFSRDAVWLYSERALDLNASCGLAGGSDLASVDLKLVPGWNQAILTYGGQTRLESAPSPESFEWTEY